MAMKSDTTPDLKLGRRGGFDVVSSSNMSDERTEKEVGRISRSLLGCLLMQKSGPTERLEDMAGLMRISEHAADVALLAQASHPGRAGRLLPISLATTF